MYINILYVVIYVIELEWSMFYGLVIKYIIDHRYEIASWKQ